MKFGYEASELEAPWVKISFGNSAVAVGEVPGEGDGMDTEFEVIDCFDGKQLCFRRRADDEDLETMWEELTTKAHHLLLELHTEAVAEAQRSKERLTLCDRLETKLQSLSLLVLHISNGDELDDTGIGHLRNADDFLDKAYEALDEAYDPEETVP